VVAQVVVLVGDQHREKRAQPELAQRFPRPRSESTYEPGQEDIAARLVVLRGEQPVGADHAQPLAARVAVETLEEKDAFAVTVASMKRGTSIPQSAAKPSTSASQGCMSRPSPPEGKLGHPQASVIVHDRRLRTRAAQELSADQQELGLRQRRGEAGLAIVVHVHVQRPLPGIGNLRLRNWSS
jgi:hypothetical protein